ncbi:MoxR family ATPase [Planktothricoides raciborskii]|uniref:MoxR family ATPase n=1 Tax=Planktothricoides raciborskii GIHE-MW2 TaxID=2792601 RepID=A0AAU8JA63_9CYAN
MAEILEPTLTLNYTGKVQPPPGHEDEKGLIIYPYLPSPELVEAVNLAITLQRPLLLQGEPGSGKTKLAQAVAFELKLPYLSWNIKSTSKAQDGLYTYNNLGRLRDAQLLALNRVTDPEEIQRLDDPKTYRDWGPMGQAFMNEQRTVLLIDEIDKADIDFPNDLLLELDEKRFTIPETKEEIIAKHPPIIFITSNAERDLPDAFLRRCLFHYIEFPQRERLIEIVLAHFNISEDNPVIDLIEAAVDKFSELREILQEEKGQGAKKVSTSELIDWVDILRRYPQDEVRGKLNGRLPYLGVLLKSWDDHRRYLKRIEEAEGW